MPSWILKGNEATLPTEDSSGIWLDIGLLQVRDGMSCPRGEGLNNSVLWLRALASKWLFSAESRHRNIEREVKCDYRLQITGSHLQKDIGMLSQWLQQILLCIAKTREK